MRFADFTKENAIPKTTEQLWWSAKQLRLHQLLHLQRQSAFPSCLVVGLFLIIRSVIRRVMPTVCIQVPLHRRRPWLLRKTASPLPLQENNEVGRELVRFNATDPDVGTNGVVLYRLLNDSFASGFSVGSSSGRLYVNKVSARPESPLPRLPSLRRSRCLQPRSDWN